MAQKHHIEFICDNQECSKKDMIDIAGDTKDALPIVSKWRAVMSGDAPNDGKDHHRWYCCLNCVVTGEQQHSIKKIEAATKRLSGHL
jgi:hypothetical protein